MIHAGKIQLEILQAKPWTSKEYSFRGGIINPLHLIGKGSSVMRAAPSTVLLLEILLIRARIVIFNGFPRHGLRSNFQATSLYFFSFFFFLLSSHPWIISQLFETFVLLGWKFRRIEKEAREYRLRFEFFPFYLRYRLVVARAAARGAVEASGSQPCMGFTHAFRSINSYQKFFFDISLIGSSRVSIYTFLARSLV